MNGGKQGQFMGKQYTQKQVRRRKIPMTGGKQEEFMGKQYTQKQERSRRIPMTGGKQGRVMGNQDTQKQGRSGKIPMNGRKQERFMGARLCRLCVKISADENTKARLKLPGFYHIIRSGDRGLTPVSC